MKKCMAVLAGFLFFMGAAFAEGYVNANDLEVGSFTGKVELEDGFAIYGSAEKPITVDNTEIPPAPDGEVFTKRINTKGAGNTSYRCVSFPVTAGEKVTVYAFSGNKTDTRTLIIANENGDQVTTMDCPPYGSRIMAINSFKATASGTLYAYSKSGGINIYCIKVEK